MWYGQGDLVGYQKVVIQEAFSIHKVVHFNSDPSTEVGALTLAGLGKVSVSGLTNAGTYRCYWLSADFDLGSTWPDAVSEVPPASWPVIATQTCPTDTCACPPGGPCYQPALPSNQKKYAVYCRAGELTSALKSTLAHDVTIEFNN